MNSESKRAKANCSDRIEEEYIKYISSLKNGIRKFISNYPGEYDDISRARVFFTIRKRDTKIKDQKTDKFQWRYWKGIEKADLLNEENKNLIKENDLGSLLENVYRFLGEKKSPFLFTGKDVSASVDIFNKWGISNIRDFKDGHFRCEERIFSDQNNHTEDNNSDFQNVKRFIDESVKKRNNDFIIEIPQKYKKIKKEKKREYIRSIDYHFLFKGYDYCLYHALIVGGYHIFTFYINFKFASETSNNKLFLEKLWKMVIQDIRDEKKIDPVFNEEELFGIGIEDKEKEARTFWYNFLKVFESYGIQFYQNIMNNLFQKIVQEMKATANFTTFIKKTISFLLLIDESEITLAQNRDEDGDFFYVENKGTRGNFIKIKRPEEKPEEKVLNNEIIESLVKSAISVYDNSLLPLYKNILRTAIITILVDSFAHNISAHAIHAIETWMRKKAINLEKRYKIGTTTNLNRSCEILKKLERDDLTGIREMVKNCSEILNQGELTEIAKMAEKYYDLMGQKNGTIENHFSLYDLICFCITDKRERLVNQFSYKDADGNECVLGYDLEAHDIIWKFMRYLREKAAFWSGVTRNVLFSGVHISMFDLLWDFVNNPLFLGTIAASERIFKLNVYLSIGKPSARDFSDEVPKFQPIPNNAGDLQGEFSFAHIDMSIMNDDSENKKIKPPPDDEKAIPYSPYGFLRPGEDLQKIREHLSKENFFVYLPGGIVGKQSFYTILENTIRNVKHVKEDIEIKKIKEKGIDFYLKITPVGENVDNEFFIKWFKVEIYLKHEIKLVDDEGRIDERINNISERSIVDENGNPRMGGNTQDKICAAMLYRNDFDKVEEGDKKYNEIGPNNHPWITAEGNSNRADYGYLSRQFYLWKGDFIMKRRERKSDGEKGENEKRENERRFKFYHGKVDEARGKNLIRFYDKNDIDDPQTADEFEEMKARVYEAWLKKWIKTGGKTKIYRTETEDDGSFQEIDCYGISGKVQGKRTDIDVVDLNYAHRASQNIEKDILSYSSHGDFASYFILGPEPSKKLIYNEFLEMILTRIAIIDNRIFNLLRTEKNLETEYSRNTKIELLKSRLLLETYPEAIRLKDGIDSIDFSFKKNIMEMYNFVVIHLSFIENQLGYTEEKITNFIDDLILKDDRPVPENFVLVITTARGRSEWWEKLMKSKKRDIYKQFVTFRPIESIINAVSDGNALNDDFQIKINLSRVLLGS